MEPPSPLQAAQWQMANEDHWLPAWAGVVEHRVLPNGPAAFIRDTEKTRPNAHLNVHSTVESDP